MHLFQNNFKNVSSFQTTDPISDNKRTHRKYMCNAEELYNLALDLRLSEMTFGSFPAKQTGVVVSST
jgi:hypothetical protein